MRDAAERYGIRVNRGGMACCPFHDDRHPSMKVDKGFICFACGESGDVITFVSKLFSLSPFQAAMKLAADFGVSLSENPPSRKAGLQRKTLQQMQRKREEKFETCRLHSIRVLTDYLDLLEEWKARYEPGRDDEDWDDRFVEALKERTGTEYDLDILRMGSMQEQMKWIADKGKKVTNLERRMEEYRRGNVETTRDGDGRHGATA